jgi:hypothetical protein
VDFEKVVRNENNKTTIRGTYSLRSLDDLSGYYRASVRMRYLLNEAT